MDVLFCVIYFHVFSTLKNICSTKKHFIGLIFEIKLMETTNEGEKRGGNTIFRWAVKFLNTWKYLKFFENSFRKTEIDLQLSYEAKMGRIEVF